MGIFPVTIPGMDLLMTTLRKPHNFICFTRISSMLTMDFAISIPPPTSNEVYVGIKHKSDELLSSSPKPNRMALNNDPSDATKINK